MYMYIEQAGVDPFPICNTHLAPKAAAAGRGVE